jgi:hypothetical protein
MQCLLDIRTYAMIGQRSSQQQQQAEQQQQQQHRHLSTYRATLISLGEIARRTNHVHFDFLFICEFCPLFLFSASCGPFGSNIGPLER